MADRKADVPGLSIVDNIDKQEMGIRLNGHPTAQTQQLLLKVGDNGGGVAQTDKINVIGVEQPVCYLLQHRSGDGILRHGKGVSDAAENLKGGKKKQIIRELGINLDVVENRKVFNVIKRLQEGSIDSDTAFVTIKNSLDGADEYNDAEVKMKINGRNQSVQWGEFEKLMGVHDITKELHEATSLSHDYEGELTKLANMYFESIIELGDI